MKKEVDKVNNETWIHLSEEEIRIGFLSQCIEAVAEAENCDYIEMLRRMEQVDMTQGYILAHYNVLHTESWDQVVSDLIQLLHKREAANCDGQR